MVRIKHRWLLVQVLYPVDPTTSQKQSYSAISEENQPSLLGAPNPTLSLHAPTPDSVNAQNLTKLIRSQIEILFGDYGAGMAGTTLKLIYWSNATSTFILRCDRAVFRIVWATLTFMKSLNMQGLDGRRGAAGVEKPCVLQVLRVSGTIKKCEHELIRRARALCGRAKGVSVAFDAGVGAGGPVSVSDDEDEDAPELGEGEQDSDSDEDLDGS